MKRQYKNYSAKEIQTTKLTVSVNEITEHTELQL